MSFLTQTNLLLYDVSSLKIKQIVKSLDLNIKNIQEKDVFFLLKQVNFMLFLMIFMFSTAIHMVLIVVLKSKLIFYTFSFVFYLILYLKHRNDKEILSKIMVFIRKFYKFVILLDEFMRKHRKKLDFQLEKEGLLVDLIRKDMIDFINKYSTLRIDYQLSDEGWFKDFLYVKSRFVICFNELLEKKGDLIMNVRKLRNCLFLNRIFENISVLTATNMNIEKTDVILNKHINLKNTIVERMNSLNTVYNKVIQSIDDDKSGESQEKTRIISEFHSEMIKFSLFLQNKFELDEEFLDFSVVSKEIKKKYELILISGNEDQDKVEVVNSSYDKNIMIKELETMSLSLLVNEAKETKETKEAKEKEKVFSNLDLNQIENDFNSSKERSDFYFELTEKFKLKKEVSLNEVLDF